MSRRNVARRMSRDGDRRGTRGIGLLEHYLSLRRIKKAESLIPAISRRRRILDIGCGLYPLFLKRAYFQEKHALDKHSWDDTRDLREIVYTHQDIEENPRLPFPANHFDVISMLAVIEHLRPPMVPTLLLDVHRILNKGGAFIITTPAAWTDFLLRTLALFRFVSPEEIREHQEVYNHVKLRGLLQQAGFRNDAIELGYFEFTMNLWGRAIK